MSLEFGTSLLAEECSLDFGGGGGIGTQLLWTCASPSGCGRHTAHHEHEERIEHERHGGEGLDGRHHVPLQAERQHDEEGDGDQEQHAEASRHLGNGVQEGSADGNKNASVQPTTTRTQNRQDFCLVYKIKMCKHN